MTQCRATSFYLAPGKLTYFHEGTLVALVPDTGWVEIKHRRDVARLIKTHPEWDGTVLYAKGIYGVDRVRETLVENPARIERWQTDERVIEGRRPRGEQFILHKLCWSGLHKTGGARQVVDEGLPGASKPLRASATEFLERHRENAALRLSLAAALREHLTDDEIAMILSKDSVYELQLWAPVDINRYRTNFKRATENLPRNRVREMARAVLDGSSLTGTEISAAISGRARGHDKTVSRSIVAAVLERDDDTWESLCLVSDLEEGHQREIFERLWRMPIEQQEDDYWGYDRRTALFDDAKTAGLFNTGMVLEAIERGEDVLRYVGVLPHDADVYRSLRNRVKTEEEHENLCAALASDLTLDRETVELILDDTANDRVRTTLARLRGLDEDIQWRLYREAVEKLRSGGSTRDTQNVITALVSSETADERLLETVLGTTHFEAHKAIISNLLKREAFTERLIEAARLCDMPYTRAAVSGMVSAQAQREMALRENSPIVLAQMAVVASDDEALKTLAERTVTFEGRLDNMEQGAKVSGISPSVTGVRVIDATTIVEGLCRNERVGSDTELADAVYERGNRDLRAYMLENPDAVLSEEVRLAAAENGDLLLREPALRTRMPYGKLQRKVLAQAEENPRMMHWMLSEAHLTPETQREICERGSLSDLLRMGGNKFDLTRETIEEMATHKSPNVRRMVAGRKKDRDITEAMAHDSDRETREMAAAVIKFEAEREASSVVSRRGRDNARVRTARREESRSEGDVHVIVSSASVRFDDERIRREHHPIEYAAHPAAVLSEMREIGGPLIVESRTSDVRRLPNFSSLKYRGVQERQEALLDASYEVREAFLRRQVPFNASEEDLEELSVLRENDSHEVTQLKPRVITSPEMLRENKDAMVNCTETYSSRISRGSTLIVAMDDQHGVCRLNIQLEHNPTSDQWEIEQINTIRNGYGRGDRAPADVTAIAQDVLERINAQDREGSEESQV